VRQPDNLPAFCRARRNGRPLIGMVRLLAAPGCAPLSQIGPFCSAH